MIRPKFGCEIAAETLTKLSEARVNPMTIDEAAFRGDITPDQLVMTSMGSRNKAVVTPYYPAIQYEATLRQRVEWSRVFGRPFVEAAIGISRKHNAASLTIRFCGDPSDPVINEASWRYPLSDVDAQTTTTEDVIAAIADNAIDGEAVPGRSGLVVVTDKRFSANNWAVSHSFDPNDVTMGIHKQVELLNFTNPQQCLP